MNLTIVNRQVRLFLAHNVIYLLLFHVRTLVVWFVQHKLIRTSSTLKGINTFGVFVRASGSRNRQTVAAVRTNCKESVGLFCRVTR